MKTIVVLSRKGGTGKTTTVHALGSGLMKHGKKVLFIDMDGQANLTLTFGANEAALNGYDILCKGAAISDTIQQTEIGDIVPGNELLHIADQQIEGAESAFILKRALGEIEHKYDYCVIDTPAALGMVTINCIIAANKIIVPVQADLYSVQGISRIMDTLESIKENTGEARTIDGILLTRYAQRTNISKSIYSDLQQIAKKYKTKVYQTSIRECGALKEAELMQKSIFDYAPRSNGAKDYTDFIIEFIG